MVKKALEPEWEARFAPGSSGFRPGRGCQDARQRIYNITSPKKKRKWGLDADIKGACDHIRHETILAAAVGFPAQNLIKAWLEAGVVNQGLFEAVEEGAAQGGVISPLLANIALHGMEGAVGVR